MGGEGGVRGADVEPLRVLIGCEYSGAVRNAFRALGHDAWSCDLLPADDGSPYHYQGDVFDIIGDRWDLGIFHPPCTFLCGSGAKHLYKLDGTGHTIRDKGGDRIPNAYRWRDLVEGAEFFRELLNADIPRVAVENPVMMGHAVEIIGEGPTQYIQPWEHGHGETKKTGLWLRNLPPLIPTDIVEGRDNRIHRMGPSEDRWKLRSATYPGIAEAMAEQWGGQIATEAAA